MANVPYVQCRLYRHAWEDAGPPLEYPFRQRWPHHLWLRCLRCGTERYDAFDTMGHLGQRKYTAYPDNYRIARDDRPTTEQLRLIIITKGRR